MKFTEEGFRAFAMGKALYVTTDAVTLAAEYAATLEAPMSVEELPLIRGSFSRVDPDVFLWAKWFHWRIDSDGYAVCGTRGLKNMVIHRIITDCPVGMEVDHIDGDRLNNLRSNLRIVTHQQNGMNRKISSNNTTGFKGVVWVNRDKRFAARIKVAGKRYYLGYFETPEEAHAAYCEKAKELHGEFARFE